MTQQIEKEPIIRTEKKRTHQGQAVKTILELLGQKPDVLAEPLHITPRQVFTILQKESIQPKKLKVIAEVLEVPVKLLENFDAKEVLKTLINQHNENNTLSDEAAMVREEENNYQNDPIVIESFERIIKEERENTKRALKEKDDKIEELYKQLYSSK